MLRLHSLHTLVLYACMAIPGVASAAGESITPVRVTLHGDADYFPYSYVKGNVLRGLYPEIIRKVDERLPDYEIVLEPIPWRRGLVMLEEGEAFGLFPPYRFEAERPYIKPYSAPLGSENLVIVCREDRLPSDFKGRWPEDYKGMTVSVNLGFAVQSKPFWASIHNGSVKRAEFPSNSENLIQLAAFGSVDCYANDRNAISASYARLVKRFGDGTAERDLAPIRETTVLSPQTAHIGYAARYAEHFAYGADFIKLFDEALREFQASPEYESFVTKFWAELED